MMIRIAVIGDTHVAPEAYSGRRCDLAETLLLDAVNLLNRLIRPDITLIVGDLVDDGTCPAGRAALSRVAEVINRLDCPNIIIPGNHDGDPDAFYRIMPRPAETMDFKGHRFLNFVDPEEPDWNARRTQVDLARMYAARAEYEGPIVTVQHVPVFPPRAAQCPYNYTNAEQVIRAIRECRISLAISGHYHRGLELIQQDGCSFLATPALCEPPFAFLEINLEDQEPSVIAHQLARDQGQGADRLS